jgi:hypothetical protein
MCVAVYIGCGVICGVFYFPGTPPYPPSNLKEPGADTHPYTSMTERPSSPWWAPKPVPRRSLVNITAMVVLEFPDYDAPIFVDQDQLDGLRHNLRQLQYAQPMVFENVVHFILSKPMTSFPHGLKGLDAQSVDVLTLAQIMEMGDDPVHGKLPYIPLHAATVVKSTYTTK